MLDVVLLLNTKSTFIANRTFVSGISTELDTRSRMTEAQQKLSKELLHMKCLRQENKQYHKGKIIKELSQSRRH